MQVVRAPPEGVFPMVPFWLLPLAQVTWVFLRNLPSHWTGQCLLKDVDAPEREIGVWLKDIHGPQREMYVRAWRHWIL